MLIGPIMVSVCRCPALFGVCLQSDPTPGTGIRSRIHSRISPFGALEVLNAHPYTVPVWVELRPGLTTFKDVQTLAVRFPAILETVDR